MWSRAGAALAFHPLGDNIDRVLGENFDSVRASTAMIESLERQDSAVLALLLGKNDARHALEASEESFHQASARARANITFPEEEPVIEDIEQRFAAFAAARDQLLGARPEYPLRAYDEDFRSPRGRQGRRHHLLEINHQAMVEADRQAQATASQRATVLALLVLLALFSLAFLSRALNRTLLERLDELAEVAEAIAGGSFDRRAATQYTDELGAVARQLNAVLDRQQEVENTMVGRTALYRDLLVGLLGALPRPAAIVGLDGRIGVDPRRGHRSPDRTGSVEDPRRRPGRRPGRTHDGKRRRGNAAAVRRGSTPAGVAGHRAGFALSRVAELDRGCQKMRTGKPKGPVVRTVRTARALFTDWSAARSHLE